MLPAVSTIELPTETQRASFPPVHDGGRDTNAVVTSRKTLAPLDTIMARARAEGLVVYLNSLN
jgi:hypothetical protein